MKLKALILSMDGVLADTHEFGHLEAFNLTFKNEGLDWYWNNKIYQNLLNVAGDREKIEYYMAKHKPSFQ